MFPLTNNPSNPPSAIMTSINASELANNMPASARGAPMRSAP